MSKINQQNNLIAGLVIGSAIGTLTGLFLATRGNKNTRVIVRKSLEALPELTEDFVSTAQRRGKKWSRLATEKFNQSLTRVQKAIATGIEASKLEAKSGQSLTDNQSESF